MNFAFPCRGGVRRLRALRTALALVISAATAEAQRVISPEIHPDNSVTFRLAAPGAAQVTLNLEGNPSAPLQRQADGIWTVTTPPLDPDYYGYGFSVDGVATLDPNNLEMKPNLIWASNMLHVPGPASLSWEVGQVPRGELHRHFYHSAVCGDDRDYLVYTPPGYDPAGSKRYPTLYLLHGFSDDATGWTANGKAHVILDNLIAQKKAKPMVVVMPLGYGAMEIVAQARADNGNLRAGGLPLMVKNAQLFQKALLKEVLPMVEKEYHISQARADRAIAGLSMGGSESLQTGLAHPDLFGWVGSFSAGGMTDDFPAMLPSLKPAADAKLKLLWIACGTEDTLYPLNEKLRAYLTSQGIPHTDVSTHQAHIWPVWRRNLTAFAPLLFR